VDEVEGYVGNFTVTISTNGATQVLKIGTIIVAVRKSSNLKGSSSTTESE